MIPDIESNGSLAYRWKQPESGALIFTHCNAMHWAHLVLFGPTWMELPWPVLTLVWSSQLRTVSLLHSLEHSKLSPDSSGYIYIYLISYRYYTKSTWVLTIAYKYISLIANYKDMLGLDIKHRKLPQYLHYGTFAFWCFLNLQGKT